MSKKKKNKVVQEQFWNADAVRTLPPPDWEAHACSEAEAPVIILRPKAWVKLSQALFMADKLEFGAYGITRKEGEATYIVDDIILPKQEATSAFVQPLFPEEEHAVLQAEDENVGLFTHIHSHHSMNMSFSAYDREGPLRNNLAAVVINHKMAPRGFAVTRTPCGKVLRKEARVVVGDDAATANDFAAYFKEQWVKPSVVIPMAKNAVKKWAPWDAEDNVKDGVYVEDIRYPATAEHPDVQCTPLPELDQIAALVLDGKHHFRLNSEGGWWHQYKHKCFRKVYSDDTIEALWGQFWFAVDDTETVAAAYPVCPEENTLNANV